jgi:hypothetical protein
MWSCTTRMEMCVPFLSTHTSLCFLFYNVRMPSSLDHSLDQPTNSWSNYRYYTNCCVSYQVLSAVLDFTFFIKLTAFWDVAPCNLVEVCRRFRDRCCLHRPDDGGSKYLWNVDKLLPDYTVLQPRRQQSSYSPPWEPQILQFRRDFMFSRWRVRRRLSSWL